MTRHFTPELFRFLGELAANNNREWFNANKERYVEAVQEPGLSFITDFAPRLARISPHFRADAKVQGGSLYRIHRDTRFGADKTPYKVNSGVHFRHESWKDAHAPGYYLHLQPGSCFIGVGVWRPDTATSRMIRDTIVDEPDAWGAAARGKRLSAWALAAEDALKRVPAEHDPEHPHADDLRKRSFVAMRRLTQREVTASGFIDDFEARITEAGPFMSFLCGALGVGF
jgi:uncharacterized protein (TIGR02453 family)